MKCQISRSKIGTGGLLVLALICGNAFGLTDVSSTVGSGIKKGDNAEVVEFEATTDLYMQGRKLVESGNRDLGMSILRKAAERGHPLAMHDLGLLLRRSENARDVREAAVWYRRAAEWKGWGFPGSQNNLGDMYEEGDGIGKSAGDAIYWYTRSALQGEPTAYLSLGTCFADGVGVTKDLIEAHFWLSLAAERLTGDGNRSIAQSKIEMIERSMSLEQIAMANRKAGEYKPYFQTKLIIGDPLPTRIEK